MEGCWEPLRTETAVALKSEKMASSSNCNSRKVQRVFDHLIQRANSLEKTLMLGQIESRRRRGRQKMRWLDGITDSMDMNLTSVQQMQVLSMGWEDPLEQGMVTHYSSLAWRIPWTEEPGGLQFMGLLRVRYD